MPVRVVHWLLIVTAAFAVSPVLAQTKPGFNVDSVVALFELVIDADSKTAQRCLQKLAEKIQSGEISGDQLTALRSRLEATVMKLMRGDPDTPLFFDAAIVAASWRDKAAAEIVRQTFQDPARPIELRVRAFDTLIAANNTQVPPGTSDLLSKTDARTIDFQSALLASLGRCEDPQVADIVLGAYARMDAELKPKAIELLTARVAWSQALLKSIGSNRIPKTDLNANQVRKLLDSRDQDLRKLVIENWGTVRTERNPAREEVIIEMRDLLTKTKGDPLAGELTFNKVCAQCHKMHGQGQDVGPDITGNGRASFEQLLSNVFDPSLVIGSAYQARAVITTDGRVLSGLLVEDNDQRIVLKVQGGKRETVAREDVDEVSVSNLSLMPEGLEKQLTPQELADLFAYICLDLPPSDPKARRIPGTPAWESSVRP